MPTNESGVLTGEDLKEELLREYIKLNSELAETKAALTEIEKEIIGRYPKLYYEDQLSEMVYVIGTRKRWKCNVDLICELLSCPDQIKELLSSSPFAQGKVKRILDQHMDSQTVWWEEQSAEVQIKKIPQKLMKQMKEEGKKNGA